ncbi:hypothetical protein GCM10007147_25570 [Nocardiopsis kunsanensis]|uniref:Carbohydrate kinase FGGY C-terminal domain-containing protein n=1 Tax=Nocardiopsis kunsanensis TaxID=141693 RepID=A0A918XDC4_9ACTN|nr:hypothetical protein [Nocardiopsis kunsanensis]GHD26975.1 hypothetical protein GCM10007147_25570 [Nocardiopsis kunsanensis]
MLAPSATAGGLTPRAAEELGLAPGTLVGAGGGDQHGAALGLCVAPGDVVVSRCTSGVVYTTSPDPVFDVSVVDGVADMTGGYLPLVSVLNAARVTDTFARLLGVGHEELSALALSAPDRPGPALAAYRQLLADSTGRPALLTEAGEASAHGACVQAAAVATGTGVHEVRETWRPIRAIAAEPRERAWAPPPMWCTTAAWSDADGSSGVPDDDRPGLGPVS